MVWDIFIGCLLTLAVIIVAMIAGSTTRALLFCIKEYASVSAERALGKKEKLRHIRSYIVILSVILLTHWAGMLVLLEKIYQLF